MKYVAVPDVIIALGGLPLEHYPPAKRVRRQGLWQDVPFKTSPAERQWEAARSWARGDFMTQRDEALRVRRAGVSAADLAVAEEVYNRGSGTTPFVRLDGLVKMYKH